MPAGEPDEVCRRQGAGEALVGGVTLREPAGGEFAEVFLRAKIFQDGWCRTETDAGGDYPADQFWMGKGQPKSDLATIAPTDEVSVAPSSTPQKTTLYGAPNAAAAAIAICGIASA